MIIWRTKLKNLTNIFSEGVKTVQNSNEYSIAKEFLQETVDFARKKFLPQKRVTELSEKRQMELTAIQRQIRSRRLQLNNIVSTQTKNDETPQTPTVKDMVGGPPPLPLKQEASTAEASSTASMQQRQIKMKETSHKQKEDESVDGDTKSGGTNGDQRDDGTTTTATTTTTTTTTSDTGQ